MPATETATVLSPAEQAASFKTDLIEKFGFTAEQAQPFADDVEQMAIAEGRDVLPDAKLAFVLAVLSAAAEADAADEVAPVLH